VVGARRTDMEQSMMNRYDGLRLATPWLVLATWASGQQVKDELVQGLGVDAGFTTHGAGDCPPIIPGEPSAIGQWETLPFLTNTGVVHGAVLPTGKVIWWSGELGGGPFVSGLWDPATNDMTTQSMLGIDQFCAYQVFLGDGRLFTIGGGGNGAPGFADCLVFDNELETWSARDSMEFGRWYPSSVVLGDGRVITFSGWFGPVEEVEIYEPEVDQWTTLPESADRYLEIYPSIHLMPDGRLFYSGTCWYPGAGWNGAITAFFDVESSTWTDVSPHIIGDRAEAMSVLLPEKEAGAVPWRVMVAGGNGKDIDQDTAEIMDLSQPDAVWQQIDDMHFPRNNANGVILPDGNVLFCSGIEGFKFDDARIDTLDAEMFDPATTAWTVMDAMTYPAQYHSVGLLLPDGPVLKTGGQDGAPLVHEMEVFSPPYLFRGPRPTITAAPSTLSWGGGFTIETTDADSIDMVSLVRMGTMTHHTNTGQRFLSLEFTVGDAGEILVSEPAHQNIAPPGPYYLTILNECGAPSESKIVMVGPTTECYGDFNGDTELNVLDFVAFQNAWTAHDQAADCDDDAAWTILDFICFQNAFQSGCP
jgi:hypothetical protein